MVWRVRRGRGKGFWANADACQAAQLLQASGTKATIISWSAFTQQQQIMAANYREIGFGECGVVFERLGQNYVIKVARPFYEDSLWADFSAHFQVRKAFESQSNEPTCRIMKLFSYVPKDNQRWWEEKLPFLSPTCPSLYLPTMALITERILPLPKTARQALIDAYCPAISRTAVAANPTNRDCLARIYLGRRRPPGTPQAPNFTLRNFNLCLDQAIDLEFPVNLFAAGIGEALAIIHWVAHVDAYDIEFVLGSEGGMPPAYTQDLSRCLNLSAQDQLKMAPHTDVEDLLSTNSPLRTPRLFVLDFNL
ncbi:unnamed protein product [Penicillium olsonii]|nr:unnamed protein product [Penicillium olsonii]